jgi:hypothetical protein
MRRAASFHRQWWRCARLAGFTAAGVMAAPAWAAAQTPATIPSSLQVLEQKMAQIRFSTARVSARVVFGEVGPPGGSAELGAGIQGPNSGIITSTVGVFRLSPLEASTTSKAQAEGLPTGKDALSAPSRVRVVGDNIYTYTPSALRYDHGRPWVRSKQPAASRSDGGFAVPEGLSDSSAPFAKMTVYGQQVTEFTASLTMATLLPGKLLERFTKALSALAVSSLVEPSGKSPKQREEAKSRSEVDAKKVSELPVEIELFVAPSGLPVRTNTVIGNRNEAIGSEQDILALEVPVDVHAPPASETISEAQLRKLRERRVCSIISVHAAHGAQSAICPAKLM